MSKQATFSDVDGKTPVQAAVDEVRRIKTQMKRKVFLTTMLGITPEAYDEFMHGISVWNERASPTIGELNRLKEKLS